MNRRSFLTTAATLSLAQLLSGCNRASPTSLQVRLLKDSVPAQILKEFQRRSGQAGLGFLVSEQLADLYALLKPTSEPGSAQSGNQAERRLPDLMTLGDYWLTAAIQQKLIQPLNFETVAAWRPPARPDIWQPLVRRNAQGQPSDTGEIWAAPYRWGTLMIAYHAEQFRARGWTPPKDWGDLWRSEFQRHLSLPDSPRSVVGLVLKKLGRSVNSENLEAVAELQSELTALHQQVKTYSSDTYLQPLVLEDTLLAVGWSNEILPLVERNHSLAAVVPQGGTILTADLWVHPAAAPQLNAEQSTRLNQWIEFCWNRDIATQLSLLTAAASPVFFGVDRSQLPTTLQQSPLLFPSSDVLQNSEFLLPLPDGAINQYRQLWVGVRQAEKSR